MRRLAIISTHPIQYYAPVFRLLSQRGNVIVKVFYTWGEGAINKFDPGFNKNVIWDIPTMEGYQFDWVPNTSREPGSHHFKGIINPGLIRMIQSWQPDALLVYGWGYDSHLKALRYFKKKIPVFFRGDSTLIDQGTGIKAMSRRFLLKWIYRHVDHAFYVGTHNKAYFKKFGLTDDQLSFAPHAVDNSRFAEDRCEEAAQLRQDLGLKETDILILFAGKLEEKKAPFFLLDAFINLKLKHVKLLFIGNGELEESLKRRAENISEVRFMPFQNQTAMPAAYQACDLFCLPSKGPGETWGLAINEAMACNKAILSSDKVGCSVDLVINGYNGSIFESGNAADLAACLTRLTVSRAKLFEMGQNSGKLIQDWTLERIARIIENKINL